MVGGVKFHHVGDGFETVMKVDSDQLPLVKALIVVVVVSMVATFMKSMGKASFSIVICGEGWRRSDWLFSPGGLVTCLDVRPAAATSQPCGVHP